MRFTILVLLLLSITLAFSDIDEYRGEKEEELDQDLSKLTCLLGYKSALRTKLTTCKTDPNNNCVIAHLSAKSEIYMSKTLYGCSPQFSCERLTGYLRYLENHEVSYCKTCDLKYDECKKDLQ